MLLLSSADFFSKIHITGTIRVPNSLDPDQALIVVQIVAKVISRRQKSKLAGKDFSFIFKAFGKWNITSCLT